MGVLEDAIGVVNGERAKMYGSSDENCYRLYRMIASSWGALLGIHIEPRTATLMLASMKICRNQFRPKRDDLVDGPGYFDITDKIDNYTSKEFGSPNPDVPLPVLETLPEEPPLRECDSCGRSYECVLLSKDQVFLCPNCIPETGPTPPAKLCTCKAKDKDDGIVRHHDEPVGHYATEEMLETIASGGECP